MSRPGVSPDGSTIPPEQTYMAQAIVEESQEARIERLGRMRPEVFTSTWKEVGFVFSVAMSQVLSEYFVSGFSVLVPTLTKDLSIASTSATWPASAFSLVLASFLLVFGRLADMYGGYPVYVLGLAWLTVWSLIAGFSQNELMIDFCRAIQGLGPAAFLPSSMMLLGSTYRPGPRKNLVFSIYGACAPFGFFGGIFFAGLSAQYATWRWYFWIGAILSMITAVIAYFTVPSDVDRNRSFGIKMDWWGAILIVSGLILFTFAIIDSSHAPQQWKTPYIYITLILGVLALAAAAYTEGWIAKQPLLPFSVFQVKGMLPLSFALFFTYGSLGIFLLYATFYCQDIMGASPLQIVGWYTPMAVGGCLISTIGGFFLHIIPGTVLMIISALSWVVAPVLLAIAPAGANYWAYIFPSMICGTIGIDITFNVTNVFITTSLPQHQQGLAGAIIMILFQLSIAVLLGFAEIVNTYTRPKLGLKASYQAVFWFEVAAAVAALIVLVLFVRIEKAHSDLSVEEREEAAALEAAGHGETLKEDGTSADTTMHTIGI